MVRIWHNEKEYTVMTKETYDAQQAQTGGTMTAQRSATTDTAAYG
jgi:hypothetical protein